MSERRQDATAETRWTDVLHAAGLRRTVPRLLVLDALSRLGHGRVEVIHQAVSEYAPTVSISTVYRQLEALAEHGVVSHTHLVAGTKSYQLVTHADHVHLVCRECGAVSELDPGVAARFTAEVAATHGFALDFGHLSVFGRCAECAMAPIAQAG